MPISDGFTPAAIAFSYILIASASAALAYSSSSLLYALESKFVEDFIFLF
jgi:hypothetical protein